MEAAEDGLSDRIGPVLAGKCARWQQEGKRNRCHLEPVAACSRGKPGNLAMLALRKRKERIDCELNAKAKCASLKRSSRTT